MNTSSHINRRHFLGAAAASTSAVLMSVPQRSIAATAAAEPIEGETKHFRYRLAPADPYIDSHRDNKAFGFSDGKILLSEDNAQTWPHSAAFPNAKNITFSCWYSPRKADTQPV